MKTKVVIHRDGGQGRVETFTRELVQRTTSGVFVTLEENGDTGYGIAKAEWFPFNSSKQTATIVSS